MNDQWKTAYMAWQTVADATGHVADVDYLVID